MDQIEKDMQNSKNELKRLLNFEQYLANTIEQIGQTKKSQIEQIVQNAIQNQMNQHIQNSQQFVDDMNKYKKQFDEILKGQLAYVQEAHKKYILDDQENKLFTSRFNDQFEKLQKHISSNYIAMFEKLTNYVQQVEDKTLNFETKYINSLRTIKDDIQKNIDQGIQDFKKHLNGQEQQLSKKVGIDQFKALLDDYFQTTYNTYHIQIQEAKDIFEKISGRQDFGNFYDNKLKDLSNQIEREINKKDDDKKVLLEKQKEKIEELQQKLEKSQRQFNVTDNQVNKLFSNTGKNLGIHETMKGQELIDNSKQIKEQYNKLLQKSELVFNEMEKTIQKLKEENLVLRSKGDLGQKAAKKIKIKSSVLKQEQLDKITISQNQKQQGISTQSQLKNTQEIGRKSSADSSPQFKKNNAIFQNQGSISPISSSNKESQSDIPILPQDQLLGSQPLFPAQSIDSRKHVLQKPNERNSELPPQQRKTSSNNVKFDQQQEITKNSQSNKSSHISPITQNISEQIKKGKKDNIFNQQNEPIDGEGSLIDEDLQREIQEMDEEQIRRKNEYQLFESNIPQHQFLLFDDKKRSSQSSSLRQSMTIQNNPSQQLTYSQQNASIATFNPLVNSKNFQHGQNLTNSQQETPYYFTVPNQDLPQPPIFGNMPPKQIVPQNFQTIPSDVQIIKSLPIVQQSIPIIQQNLPIVQQNTSLIPQGVLISQPISQNNTPKRNIHGIHSLSPQDRNSYKKDQVVYLAPKPPLILSPRIQDQNIPLLTDVTPTKHVIPVQSQFNTIDVPDRYKIEQQQIQKQLQQQMQLQQSIQQQQLQKQQLLEQKQQLLQQQQQQQNQQFEQIHLEKEQQQLIDEREKLLNQQEQIKKQIHSIEAQQSVSRQQRDKSTDIVHNSDISLRIQEPVSDQYFSLNPQYQQQRIQNASSVSPTALPSLPAQVMQPNLSQQNTPVNQNQQSNFMNSNRFLKSSKRSNNNSYSDLKDISKLENSQKKQNDMIDPNNIQPSSTVEQRDHLQNLQKLTINPYQYNPPSDREQNNILQNQQVSPVNQQQQVIYQPVEASEFFSNSVQQQKPIKINQIQSDRNQIQRQQQQTLIIPQQQPLIIQQQQPLITPQQQSLFAPQQQPNVLFTKSQKGKAQVNQVYQNSNINQFASLRRNVVSPPFFDNQSQSDEQFTFKPSLSHQSSNQRIQDLQKNKQFNSIQANTIYKNQNNLNMIQMNDLEDFFEDDLMVYSPTNQRQSHNQKQSFVQSYNDSNFDDDDVFFYPEVNSDISKKIMSPISPINLSANSQKQKYILKKQSTQKKTTNNLQQNNTPTPQKSIRPDEEIHYEKLVKRRLLYNNKTENTKDKKLKLKKEEDGKLKDVYNKYIYDEKGNPIQFSQPSIAFLVNSNLIEII